MPDEFYHTRTVSGEPGPSIVIYSEPGSYSRTQTTGKLESISHVSSKIDSEIAQKEAQLAELEARLAELEGYQASQAEQSSMGDTNTRTDYGTANTTGAEGTNYGG
ncbi:hypothetical protein I317_03448 [Kwoniella heveanensis CBS 569]|nr:hypothetical protein I317_03448 [Kwoniella heveanensis CBS 569]